MTIEIDPATGAPIIPSKQSDGTNQPKANDFTVGSQSPNPHQTSEPTKETSHPSATDKHPVTTIPSTESVGPHNKPMPGMFGGPVESHQPETTSHSPQGEHAHHGPSPSGHSGGVASTLTTTASQGDKQIGPSDAPATNAPLANLIGEAKKSNALLDAENAAKARVAFHSERLSLANSAKAEHDATVLTKQALIRTILKDSGADTMSQNVAYAKIVEVLGW